MPRPVAALLLPLALTGCGHSQPFRPEAIPYESPRYRAWADLDHNGYVDGPAELMPLYLAAARDYTQPIFAYGPPRLVRLGVELVF